MAKKGKVTAEAEVKVADKVVYAVDPDVQELLLGRDVSRYSVTLKSLTRHRKCLDPIVVWNGVILDGHRRYKVCEDKGISYTIDAKDFKNKWQALQWVINNELMGNYVTDERHKWFLYGKEFKILRDIKVPHLRDDLSKKHNLWKGTAQAAYQYVLFLDAVQQKYPEVYKHVLFGDCVITKEVIGYNFKKLIADLDKVATPILNNDKVYLDEFIGYACSIPIINTVDVLHRDLKKKQNTVTDKDGCCVEVCEQDNKVKTKKRVKTVSQEEERLLNIQNKFKAVCNVEAAVGYTSELVVEELCNGFKDFNKLINQYLGCDIYVPLLKELTTLEKRKLNGAFYALNKTLDVLKKYSK